MIIEGYNTARKNKIISADNKIYAGDKKRFSIYFVYDDNGRNRNMWKEFDNIDNAKLYITEISKLI